MLKRLIAPCLILFLLVSSCEDKKDKEFGSVVLKFDYQREIEVNSGAMIEDFEQTNSKLINKHINDLLFDGFVNLTEEFFFNVLWKIFKDLLSSFFKFRFSLYTNVNPLFEYFFSIWLFIFLESVLYGSHAVNRNNKKIIKCLNFIFNFIF